MENTQDFATHTRWHPIYHFVMAPMMLINFVYSIVRLVQDPGWDRGEYLFLAIALVILTLLARVYPLKVQDRVIRLEERLRVGTVLPPEEQEEGMNLSPAQYVALRFASDEELSGLIAKISSGELTELKEIKQAIKTWRPDHFRV